MTQDPLQLLTNLRVGPAHLFRRVAQ
jgi:hypothetical protein